MKGKDEKIRENHVLKELITLTSNFRDPCVGQNNILTVNYLIPSCGSLFQTFMTFKVVLQKKKNRIGFFAKGAID